ncbi:MAG: T9SS type A sorting domain-containing protein [Bacteroidia bacterium]|nr:T9SS type A sorting domain-containing protein [Bacteroidia bacterium]MDW8133509.1 T9SS type A sorting domain-containing protein [Bacteroidia bacterium]
MRWVVLWACIWATMLWAQPDLFFNQGALVYVQANALVYVQGGMQTNDNGANNGVLENLGTIQCVDGVGGYRGHFKIGPGAEVNSRPNSWIYLQGHYHNIQGSHRSTGTHNAHGNTNLGGTIEFNGTTPQLVAIRNSSGNSQDWTFYDVRINNTNPTLAGRFVTIDCEGADYASDGTRNAANCAVAPGVTYRDIWVENTLTFVDGRIHTINSGNLSTILGIPLEVRILNTATTAVSRPTWPPFQPAAFATLAPQNQDEYVYGYMRRNMNSGAAYPFAVGDVHTGRGLQGVEVTSSANHYVRVFFDPTVQAAFSESPYCRPGDPGPTRNYTPLNNGRWEIMPFAAVDATGPNNPAGPASVRMFNRVVTNATTDGNCPAAGTPGDAYWPGRPSDQCYIGYNQRNAPPGVLNPPNNCEGHNQGWDVIRSGFSAYNQNTTYYYATVYAANAPLPAENIKLYASPAGRSIGVRWEVSPEREYILGYELYRSTDGINFSRIAQVDKQGTTIYHHQDRYVEPNVRYYYRVEQHDIFGNIRQSNIAEAILPSSGESFSAHLYPNPAAQEAWLNLTLPEAGPVSFQVYDMAGKLVVEKEYTLSAGSHRLDLSTLLAQVAAGNYNALVNYKEQTQLIRLIKTDKIH